MNLCFAAFEFHRRCLFFKRGIFHARLMKWFVSARFASSRFGILVSHGLPDNFKTPAVLGSGVGWVFPVSLQRVPTTSCCYANLLKLFTTKFSMLLRLFNNFQPHFDVSRQTFSNNNIQLHGPAVIDGRMVWCIIMSTLMHFHQW